ncbi:hypothetical protein ACWEP4_34695 [Streptomyces sp. NPDC004227]
MALVNSCANLAGYFAPQFVGTVRATNVSYTAGLFVIAAVELVGVALIFAFIRKESTAAAAPEPDPGPTADLA